MSVERAAEHYDRVTEGWRRWVMGDELHFGLFRSADEPLASATHALTMRMAMASELSAGLSVLDVGCGIGTQAMLLASEYGCRTTGITISAVGLELSRARAAEAGLADRCTFALADAQANGLPSASFDRVFALESVHLMPDKEAFFRESFRVLRPGGKLVLCDVVMVGTDEAERGYYATLGHHGDVAERMRVAVANTMHRAFGSSILPKASAYRAAANAAGFTDVGTQDLSAAVRPTLQHWGLNANAHREELAAELGERYLEDFFLALLHMSFGWGLLGGYLLLTARKPRA